MTRIPALLALLLLAQACVTGRPAPEREAAASEPVPDAHVAAQTLGVGDVFEVRVYGENDLSGVYRVASEGTVAFPFCGNSVPVASKTAPEVASLLTRCLADGYLKNPQVTVFIKEYNSKKVFVFGEVSKPGTFPYEDNMSVVQALTLAGGFTKQASRNSVQVTRSVEGKDRRVHVAVDDITTGKAPNFALQPGDIIYVPESFF